MSVRVLYMSKSLYISTLLQMCVAAFLRVSCCTPVVVECALIWLIPPYHSLFNTICTILYIIKALTTEQQSFSLP